MRRRTIAGEGARSLENRESIRAAQTAATIVGRIEAWAGGLLVAGGALLVGACVPEAWRNCCWAVTALALLSAVIESVFIVPLAVKNFRVEIVPAGVLVYRGAVFRSVDHVPTSKITVVRCQVGPLLRHLGVAKCVLFTPAREITLLPMAGATVERLMQLGTDVV